MTVAAPRGTDTAPRPAVSFRRVLLLCVPALILGAVLRISLLVAIPEVFYGADSNSYFEAAWRFWTHGDISLNPKRRFFYPIVLVFTPLLPGSTAVGVAVLQHILGLVIIVGIGWIVAQMTRFPNVWVPLATCLAAMWPRMFWYEHEMIAEVWLLAAFVAAVALAVPCGTLKDTRRLFWFLVALAAIVACKPHGRALWAGLMVVAVAMAGNPLKWEKKSLAMIAFAVLIIFTTGSERQGNWLLLNTTLPLVNTEGEPYAEYRAILRPFIEEARADLPNYAQNQTKYKKALSGSRPMMGDKWLELSKNKKLYSKVAKRLAIEGVLSHPFEYAKLVVRKVAWAARADDSMVTGRFSPAQFWQAQESRNADRIKRAQNEIKLLYGLETAAYLRLVEERRLRTTWIEPWLTKLAGVLGWTNYRRSGVGQSPDVGLTILGWLLALGLAACLAPRYFICRALLWLPAACYLFATFGVGDSLRRYLHPVEWVGIVIIVIGLDAVSAFFTDGIARLRRGEAKTSERSHNSATLAREGPGFEPNLTWITIKAKSERRYWQWPFKPRTEEKLPAEQVV